MTTQSTEHLATAGEDGETTPTVLSPADFCAAVTAILSEKSGDPAHKALDHLVTTVLTSLGYGEGMNLFLDAVSGIHLDREP